MFKLIAIWLLLVTSLVVPPLLIITIPLTIWMTRRLIRRVIFVRRSRDAFLEENQILTTAKWLR